MERVTSIEEVRGALRQPRLEGRTIGFVPTMGALHEGHLSLIRASKRHADVTVVSVFVNPTQFGPNEDFDAYPRDPDGDADLLAAEGVDVLFMPTVAEMYPEGADTTVDPGALATVLCGAARPGHFAGVATVVTKLFNIVAPDIAFFGEKDYQQLKIIQRMNRDLDLGLGVIGCPIVREHDGLALSSRNAYLSADERTSALALAEALEAAASALAWGQSSGGELEAAMRDAARQRSDGAVELDYAAVVDAETLEPLAVVDRPARAIIAGRVGRTRLIDNCPLAPPAGGAA